MCDYIVSNRCCISEDAIMTSLCRTRKEAVFYVNDMALEGSAAVIQIKRAPLYQSSIAAESGSGVGVAKISRWL